MQSDTELHRRLGCRLSLHKSYLDTTTIAVEAVETEHRPLDRSFDRLTPYRNATPLPSTQQQLKTGCRVSLAGTMLQTKPEAVFGERNVAPRSASAGFGNGTW
jgi:hypothetical protein